MERNGSRTEESDETLSRPGMKATSLLRTEAQDCDAEAATFLQTGFWGSFKSEFGWKPQYFRIGEEGGPLVVLERSLAKGISFAYIPRGPRSPVPPDLRTEYLAELARTLKSHLSPACAFLRFDPPWFEEEAEPGSQARPALDRPFYRAPLDIQPPDTSVLPLSGRSDEELLAGMKPKCRYNIRLAEKKGVKVRTETGPEALDLFYALYESTAARDRIVLHPKRYYVRLLDLAAEYGGKAPDFRIWTARYEDKPLAAIITAFHGREAVYVYGASSDELRNLMPAYALQWAAIRAARDAGCALYDFYGIPPREDENHPMAGLYRFKTGFGGIQRHYAGSWDYPLRPALYAGYRTAETLRGFWYKNVRKRFPGGRR